VRVEGRSGVVIEKIKNNFYMKGYCLFQYLLLLESDLAGIKKCRAEMER
jgi:hypothetical protein